jgi:hypothetical protein
MTPKEFIDENYFSLTIDCKREINEIYQALKDYAKVEQLTLTDVNYRRELLVAMFEKMTQPQITMLEIGDYEKLADELLGN